MTDGFQDLDSKFSALESAADILEARGGDVCEVMRTSAVQNITAQRAVDTGNLRNSVQGAEDIVVRDTDTMVTFAIQTAVPYAKFIEYGTGPRGDPAVPHTAKKSWVYIGEDGLPHIGKSQPARPFMRPALYDHEQTYRAILEGALKEVYQ